jgi:hypothetical protein
MQNHENPAVVAVNWEGFLAQQAGAAFVSNPHMADPFKRAVWLKGWTDARAGLPKPETAIDAFFIVDDVLEGQSTEGFQVFFGCPHRAIGAKHGEFLRLGDARRSIKKGEPVYRVKLARRHGEHSVMLMAPLAFGGGCRPRHRTIALHDPAKVFGQVKILWEGSVIQELEAQGDLDNSDAQSLFEVNIVLADGLYHDKTGPKEAAAAILTTR